MRPRADHARSTVKFAVTRRLECELTHVLRLGASANKTGIGPLPIGHLCWGGCRCPSRFHASTRDEKSRGVPLVRRWKRSRRQGAPRSLSVAATAMRIESRAESIPSTEEGQRVQWQARPHSVRHSARSLLPSVVQRIPTASAFQRHRDMYLKCELARSEKTHLDPPQEPYDRRLIQAQR